MSPEPISVHPFIEGHNTPSISEACIDVVNPSDGQRIMALPAGAKEDVNRAVASARTAFDDGRWREAPPSFRKKTLHRFADLIEQQAGRLDALDAEEMGKPISLGVGNAAASASIMRFFAEAVDKITGDVYGSDKNSFVAQRRVPRGVIGAIVPWNFPTLNAVYKVAPALAAGNSVVLKPSELSSRSSFVLARLAMEAGLPPGALNVIPGLGKNVGKALGLHMDVDMVTFTGSTSVGRQMLQYAGQSNMKVVMAECGGKSPQIVFDDGIDLGDACRSIAQLLLINQGQLCTVGSRLLVQRSICDTVVELIASHLKNLTMGSALDAKTTVGPLSSAQQFDRVLSYIQVGKSEGATLVVGGERTLKDSGGYFVQPTVFSDVQPNARIAQEEIFGPILSVTSFGDIDEAIRLANGTIYGLVAYVWTAQLSTGMRMARGIRSGVLVNACVPIGEGAGHAFSTEPVGQSGLGTESGLAGMESYLRRQVVWFNHA